MVVVLVVVLLLVVIAAVVLVVIVVLVTNVKCPGAGESVFIKAQNPAALL